MTSHTTTGDPSGGWTGDPTGDPRKGATGEAAGGWTGEVPPGRADAVVAGAARVSDALMEVGEAAVAAVLGAAAGAGRAARDIWVADRPRRQMTRMARRRRWLHRRGWWRVAVILELIGVGAWLGGRAAVRAVRGVPAGAARGARTGWATGRDRAQTRHSTRRGATGGPGPSWGTPGPARGPARDPASGPSADGSAGGSAGGSAPAASPSRGDGEVIVDAEVVCGWPGCGTVLAADDPERLCPACRGGRPTGVDDVQVSVEVTSPTGTAPVTSPTGTAWTRGPAWTSEVLLEMADLEAAADEARTPYERSLTPEQLADFRRLKALREAGYRGPVRDGWPVASMDLDARRLTPAQVEAAIAAGGYPPEGRPWPGGGQAPRPARTPQSPAGQVAGGPGQHDQQDGSGLPAGPGNDDVQEDGMTTSDTTEMTITSGAGGTSVTGGPRMGQQLTAVGDLRAEVTELRTYAETGIQMLQALESWAAGLPDQVAGAQWSTEAVTAAAVGLAEARTVEEVRSGITGLLQAAAQAEQLGEQLAAGGARKAVAGLRPQ
jgi:hypothetical protein